MSTDATGDGAADDAGFQAFYDYLRAIGGAEGASRALHHGALMKAQHVAQQSFGAIQRQVSRIRSADLVDPSAARQATMDAQFLIAALWLLRRAACLPAVNEPSPGGGPLTFAIVLFDAELPNLIDLYRVKFGESESDIENFERRIREYSARPQEIPTVEAISHSRYQWAEYILDFDAAITASGQLTLEIRAALMRVQQQ